MMNIKQKFEAWVRPIAKEVDEALIETLSQELSTGCDVFELKMITDPICEGVPVFVSHYDREAEEGDTAPSQPFMSINTECSLVSVFDLDIWSIANHEELVHVLVEYLRSRLLLIGSLPVEKVYFLEEGGEVYWFKEGRWIKYLDYINR